MEKIIILGTGNAMVTKCYNTCFVMKCDDECFLVDAGGGNGILTQIEKSGIEWNSIRNMFVTHSHTDHILGAIWVIRKISALMLEDKYNGEFNIFCHNECVETITELCRLTLAKKFRAMIDKRIFINEVTHGDKIKTENFNLTFFDIFSTKTKQFGFTASFKSGKTLACLGDEPFNENCRELVENKDYLMCEAFCIYSQSDIFKPYEKYHSTALDAGRLAQTLNVRNLILYHTEDTNLTKRADLYKAEASNEYSGNIIVPDDLDEIDIF